MSQYDSGMSTLQRLSSTTTLTAQQATVIKQTYMLFGLSVISAMAGGAIGAAKGTDRGGEVCAHGLRAFWVAPVFACFQSAHAGGGCVRGGVGCNRHRPIFWREGIITWVAIKASSFLFVDVRLLASRWQSTSHFFAREARAMR
jgi:hypothetical protein